MSKLILARFREAREYLGFTHEQVAEACGWDTARVAALEDGNGGPVTGLELRKLSRLYRRPVLWFSDEAPPYQPPPEMLRKLEDPRLTEGDRDAVLAFAEWLQGAGPAPEGPAAVSLSEQVEAALIAAGCLSHVEHKPGFAVNYDTGSGLGGTMTVSVVGPDTGPPLLPVTRDRFLGNYETALRKAGLRVARSTHCIFVSEGDVLGD